MRGGGEPSGEKGSQPVWMGYSQDTCVCVCVFDCVYAYGMMGNQALVRVMCEVGKTWCQFLVPWD